MKQIILFVALLFAVHAVTVKEPLRFNENGVFTMIQVDICGSYLICSSQIFTMVKLLIWITTPLV